MNTPAAATGAPSSVATRDRSRSPDGLMPQATPPAASRRPRRRSRVGPDDRQAGALGQAEHEVGALHALARGALDQVVERGEGHHPAGAAVGHHADVRAFEPSVALVEGGEAVGTTNGSSAQACSTTAIRPSVVTDGSVGRA